MLHPALAHPSKLHPPTTTTKYSTKIPSTPKPANPQKIILHASSSSDSSTFLASLHSDSFSSSLVSTHLAKMQAIAPTAPITLEASSHLLSQLSTASEDRTAPEQKQQQQQKKKKKQ
ncbi:uncharacterized protein MONOS_16694 [Monocercomonoides exilis]|uniref:uncharacterized protein n=1 Tax=Monocercomonoides exilis TaxID=2049356 RepID=UPI00355A72FF|nr:hypothetical protein MONOS_16694 [Monocercomonoides exilis]|eukprot:MONOS_16694.1-p1 / transcript=MONOS_16694.1 / gene=MONOS_16694 / organism=Monocercomonoides_exilis_PA203 / gene_product=unspecified product / transcript_product=unspecified product / location=Mono_scaffold02024:1328-1678(-) / protein_length=117 / sequence_SO=supercontig / SO=protein_coding / is_pseudo=false